MIPTRTIDEYPAFARVLGCLTSIPESVWLASNPERLTLCKRGVYSLHNPQTDFGRFLNDATNPMRWRVETVQEAREILSTDGVIPDGDADRRFFTIPSTGIGAYFHEFFAIHEFVRWASLGKEKIIRIESLSAQLAPRFGRQQFGEFWWCTMFPNTSHGVSLDDSFLNETLHQLKICIYPKSYGVILGDISPGISYTET